GGRDEVPVELGDDVFVVQVPLAAGVAAHHVFALQAGGAADGGGDAGADARRVQAVRVQAAVLPRFAGADHGELGRPVHPADLLLGQAGAGRVEVDLGGDAGAERRGVEVGDGA